MAVEFEITVDNTADVLRELETRVQAALEACGIQAVGHAQDIITANIPRSSKSWYTPTGKLRDNINYKVKENECYVGTNTKYAIYNEFGTGIYVEGGGGRQTPWAYKDKDGNVHWTRGIKPIHFLKKALADNTDEYKSIMEEYLKRG